MVVKAKNKGTPSWLWGGAYGLDGATVGQMAVIESLGMRLCGVEVSRDRAKHMIHQLKARVPLAEIAEANIIQPGQYEPTPPPEKDLAWLEGEGVNMDGIETAYDVRLIHDVHEAPTKFVSRTLAAITRAKTTAGLEAIAADCKLAARVLPRQAVRRIRKAWGEKRRSVSDG